MPTSQLWQGSYIGGFGGGAWGTVGATELYSPQYGYYILPSNPYNFGVDGLLGGIQAGNDWQWEHVVAGVEAAMGYMSLNGSIADPNSLPTGAPITDLNGRWYGDITGRMGIAFGRSLVYAKGGVAVFDATGSTVDTCGRSFCGQNKIRALSSGFLTGGTVGVGSEVALSDHWRLGGELAYYDFGKVTVSGVASHGGTYTQDLRLTAGSARLFVDYRW